MTKKLLKKIVGNPQFISGVYNYCDRWCERCSLTSRCANYALSEIQFANVEAHDIHNEAFWKKLNEVFQMTLDMLKEIEDQEGVDLDVPDIETTMAKEKMNEETARNHECVCAAEIYREMVDNWFNSAKELFEEKNDELNLKMQLKVPEANPVDEADRLKDAMEVIRWYQHQIYAKLMRAIQGNLEEKPKVLDEFPNDSDGSTKVSLIAIDRSIAAWGEMCKHFPERKDDIIDLLVHLDRLRKTTEKSFPAARSFVRPGFDT